MSAGGDKKVKGNNNAGDWLFEESNETISFDEFIHSIKSTGFSEKLDVICDCNFSGRWALAAEKYWSQNS
jgi:hypothetical protein